MRSFKISLNLEVEEHFDEARLVKFLQDHLHIDMGGVVATVDPFSLEAQESLVGKRVEIVSDCGDGGDDWAVGSMGIVRSVNDGFAEVAMDGDITTETFNFGVWQLVVKQNENENEIATS